MSEDEEKVKLRRLEPAIQKFTKIVIPTDLERLRKHQINIEKVSIASLLQNKAPGWVLPALCIRVNRESEGSGDASNPMIQQHSPFHVVATLYKLTLMQSSYCVEGDRRGVCAFLIYMWRF